MSTNIINNGTDRQSQSRFWLGLSFAIAGLFVLRAAKKYLPKYFSLDEFSAVTPPANSANDVDVQVLEIDNTPNAEAERNFNALAKYVLDPARELLGEAITIVSGYRSPELNAAEGGQPDSQHLTGEAADLTCSDNARLFNLINDQLPFDTLYWEYGDNQQPDYVHVSYRRNGNNRKEIKIIE